MAKMYLYVAKDWTRFGDPNVSFLLKPGQIIDVNNPPKEWTDEWNRLFSTGRMVPFDTTKHLMALCEWWVAKPQRILIPYHVSMADYASELRGEKKVVEDAATPVKKSSTKSK